MPSGGRRHQSDNVGDSSGDDDATDVENGGALLQSSHKSYGQGNSSVRMWFLMQKAKKQCKLEN